MANVGTAVKDKVAPHTAGRTPVNAYGGPGAPASGLLTVPGSTTKVAMCGINLLGEALWDILKPRLRGLQGE
jgi:hypothetical protein